MNLLNDKSTIISDGPVALRNIGKTVGPSCLYVCDKGAEAWRIMGQAFNHPASVCALPFRGGLMFVFLIRNGVVESPGAQLKRMSFIDVE